MSAAPRVSIVIPNWNGAEHFPECMAALRAQTFRDFEVIVVDNDSSDDSLAWLAGHAPDVRVIARGDNGGFAVAVNAGIAEASGEYIALLNNDTAVEPEWLQALVRALDTTEYDFAASLMLLYDEPALVNTAGDTYSLWMAEGRQRGLGSHRSGYAEMRRVLGASGGAVMYRRRFFEAVGLFDEDFFVLHEDTDLNLRALIAGMRCLYVPGSVVRHKVGAAVRKQPSRHMALIYARNQFAVVGKDLPYAVMPIVWLGWLWKMFRNTVPLRPSKWRDVPALLARSREDAAAQREGFRSGLAKRRDVWARRRVSHRAVLRWLVRGVGAA